MNEQFPGEAVPPQPHAANLATTPEAALEAIDKQVELLVAFADRVTYSREASFTDHSPNGFGTIEVAATEEVDSERLRKELVVMLPFSHEDGHMDHCRMSVGKRHDNTWSLSFAAGYSGNHWDLIAPVATCADTLPPALAGLINLGAETVASKEGTEGMFNDLPDMTDEQFDSLHRGVSKELENIGAPLTYNFMYFPPSDAAIRPSVAARGALPHADGSHTPEDKISFKNTSVIADGFTYDRVILNGKLVQNSFREDVDEASMPELTDDERKTHPYTAIPASFGEQPEGPGRYPDTGYKVIVAEVSGGMAVSTVVEYFENETLAQAHADRTYQRDLARAQMSDEPTVERLGRVAATIKAMVDAEYAKLG